MKYLSAVLLVLAFCSVQAQDGGLSRPDLPGDIMVDIGLNSWSSIVTAEDTTNRKGWASKSIGIYYTKRYKLGNKLSFYPGVGLGMEKMGFENEVAFMDSLDYLTSLPYPIINKNKLAITYLDIPFDLRFHPSGTEDGEGFFVSVGGIFGFRMNAHTKWVYDNGGGKVRHKVSGKFNLESVRYGYQIRLGFKGAHFFYKGYMSDIFKNPLGSNDPTMTTIGINLTGF